MVPIITITDIFIVISILEFYLLHLILTILLITIDLLGTAILCLVHHWLQTKSGSAMFWKTCADVLNTIADEKGGRHTCGARTKWVKVMEGKTDDEAKALVGSEFPTECGACALATCSKNGPVFHVSIGATRIGAQQGPLIDYPTSKCRNHKP